MHLDFATHEVVNYDRSRVHDFTTSKDRSVTPPYFEKPSDVVTLKVSHVGLGPGLVTKLETTKFGDVVC